MSNRGSEYTNANNLASAQGGAEGNDGCQACHEGNWIHVRYEYSDALAVTDATYVVQKPNGGEPGGEVITEGVLTVAEQSLHKFIHVDLGDYNGEVEVFFFDDPTEPIPFQEPAPVKDERSWFERAASAVVEGAKDASNWTWGVIQGDFNEDMSVGQIITNAVVTAVPGVDQVADARDLVANSKALIWDKRYNEIAVWVGVFACLIGLVPSLGSLAKGVIKLIWRQASDMGKILIYINKALHKTGMRVNGYRFVVKLANEVVAQVGFVTKKFDAFLNIMADKIKLARHLVPEATKDALERIEHVRSLSRKMFPQIAKEIQQRILSALGKLASRAYSVLPGESLIVRRMTKAFSHAGPYRSWQKSMKREGFNKKRLEVGAIDKDDAAKKRLSGIIEQSETWRDNVLKEIDVMLEDTKLPHKTKDVLEDMKNSAAGNPDRFLEKVIQTFGKEPKLHTFKPGQKLYRVIKEDNGHKGPFWSFSPPPKSELEWRSRDAVRNDWNAGGAYIVAEVPPPPVALVGEIGPQDLEVVRNKPKYLPGGGTQIWLPTTIQSKQVKEYWHTDWNLPPTSATRPFRSAGTIEECDK